MFTNITNAEANLEGIIALNKSWDVDPMELARDMLGARFRAKCYGAQVITYRPFVLKILDGLVDSNGHCQLPLCLEEFYPHVLAYARKGIRALIDSTRAFHGLGDPSRQRLIVTNIWGTAHA